MKTNDEEMALLFSQAESRGTCVVPPDARIRECPRRQVERGKAVRPVRGAYARASFWNALSRREQALHKMRSLQQLHPDWVFCHESAALAYGLPVMPDRLDNEHVATPQAIRNATRGTVRWHRVNNDQAIETGGLRVTSLTRTVFDCMRTSDFKHALATADGALRLTGMGSSTFVSRFMEIGKGHTGSRHAIRTMRYADARSESAGESIARAAMIELGFALPELQVAFDQPMNPGRTFRVDFLWTRLDGSKVIG